MGYKRVDRKIAILALLTFKLHPRVSNSQYRMPVMTKGDVENGSRGSGPDGSSAVVAEGRGSKLTGGKGIFWRITGSFLVL